MAAQITITSYEDVQQVGVTITNHKGQALQLDDIAEKKLVYFLLDNLYALPCNVRELTPNKEVRVYDFPDDSSKYYEMIDYGCDNCLHNGDNEWCIAYCELSKER